LARSAAFSGNVRYLCIPTEDPRPFGSDSRHLVADPIGYRVRFSPLDVPESLKSSKYGPLFIIGHAIQNAHIRIDCVRWLAPVSIENGNAAPTRAGKGAWSLFMTVVNVLIASAVFSLAAAWTVRLPI
jgi:hypothetical protein